MPASRKSAWFLALLAPVALLLLALETRQGTVPGPYPPEAGGKPRTGWRDLSEPGAFGNEGRRLPSPGGELKVERPALPSASAPKRGPEIASSAWIGDVYVRVSGNESVPDHQILETLDLPEGREPRQLTRTIGGQIRTFYRSLGFARARVEAALADSDPLVLDVKIREGRVLSYGGVGVEGVTVLSNREIAALYPEPGGLVDWVRVRDADIALRKKYHELGFAAVIISGTATVAPSSSLLRYRIRVVEGIQYRVGEVSLPPELSSRFPLTSGELFRPALLDEFFRESGLSEAQLLLERNPGEGLVEITLVEREGT